MTGLQELLRLPDDIKEQITNEYGGITDFYKMVFDLYAEEYQVFTTKPTGYQTRLDAIQQQLYNIQDKLDDFGIDGHGIVTEISSDHGEIIVSRNITQLDQYLQQFGTNFEEMRKWIDDHLTR
jgi:hypothetical protein